MGAMNGVPDLLVFNRSNHPSQSHYVGLALEMKRANRAQTKVSAESVEFMQFLRLCGWRVEVCYGHLHAIRVIREYLDGNAESPTQLPPVALPVTQPLFAP
jgi:hypothetical protein